MNYDYKKIGERIRQERKAQTNSKGKPMTQDDIAARYHVKRSTVSKWESGETMPNFQTMLDMCKDFDCELGYLLCEGGYENKTRTATDICEATGLSEEAVKKLIVTEHSNVENPISPFVSKFIIGCDVIMDCIVEILICNFLNEQGCYETIAELANTLSPQYAKKSQVDSFQIEYIDKEELSKEINIRLKQHGFSDADIAFLRATTLGYLGNYNRQIDIDMFSISNAFMDIVKAYVKEGVENGGKN